MKEGFGRIKDIHNIGGYVLTPEEALEVAERRCKSIGLDVKRFHHSGIERRQEDIKIDFVCEMCGVISKNRRYDNIYRGTNNPYCSSCSGSLRGDKSQFMSRDELQVMVNDLYKSRDYSFKILNNPSHFHNTSNVETECLNCGNRETVILRYLKSGRKSCECANSRSDLEFMTRVVLITLNSDFETQFKIDTEGEIENEKPRCDFAIFNKGKVVGLIECDGIQHFKPTFGEKAFNATKRTDTIKNKYSIDNNIPLLKIKYDEAEKDIINKIIEFVKL